MVNSDCNQNGEVDSAEEYLDWGSDWCPDSLETGEGVCIAVDSPCNCLGNWIVSDVNEKQLSGLEKWKWTVGGILIAMKFLMTASKKFGLFN